MPVSEDAAINGACNAAIRESNASAASAFIAGVKHRPGPGGLTSLAGLNEYCFWETSPGRARHSGV
jgi:hypothetical protein